MPRIYKETVPSERVELDGKIYRRYPQSPRKHLRNYFSRSGSFYHKDLWTKHHGPVPDGCDIHHRDHNPCNNDIDNLECLPRAAHLAKHPDHNDTPEQFAHLARIRHLTKAWHSSPEGLAWHAENGRKAWDKRNPHALVCQCCGTAFTSLIASAKFCGKPCQHKHWISQHPDYDRQARARKAARLQPDSAG